MNLLLSDTDIEISTHTPLAGRDSMAGVIGRRHGKFLLTRPLRDVTFSVGRKCLIKRNFYSHAPCGT